MLEAFETDPEDFIASLTQCYLKILKNLLSCSKKDIDKSSCSESSGDESKLGKRKRYFLFLHCYENIRHDSDTEEDEKNVGDREKIELKHIKETMRRALGIEGQEGAISDDSIEEKEKSTNGIKIDRDMDLSPIRRKNSYEESESSKSIGKMPPPKQPIEFKIQVNITSSPHKCD